MPKTKRSEATVRRDYAALIAKWEDGDLAADPGRRGRMPSELVKIKESIIEKQKRKNVDQWFAPNSKGHSFSDPPAATAMEEGGNAVV
ncbi:hypothetical protein Pmar_PMAR027182 [Perkinsus marinus ATCC 50983]|uniref:Uncharacterized protein n=1 Tax=Perkinsus marinus (strain ATCC 50983 / TXsc) TaxID=423536 RepID=C5L7Z1_PERM5|nr:hypothetical protein Pmar_PMAR027182 [Perkinsus marinus ATCC 50983]EER07137.1 hypothetical protein Pmar_PMAR027182 [Perkinsus marinus ATCC 50983]|eukprot:XP_002775321.1 hypothetical protein Pmar_PMAR027182 [Perkinsus marinus ATCC 50983]